MSTVVRFLIIHAIVGAVLATAPVSLAAQRWEPVVDLRGTWKFQLGDDSAWASPTFNDRSWDSIFVPSNWEDEGFPGYDGWAWYRKSFALPRTAETDNLTLHLGRVDDASEVFLNGNFIGFAGELPPRFATGVQHLHQYRIPPQYLKSGRVNVIAVRVYDNHQQGGIVSGRIGIYLDKDALVPDLNLAGMWQLTKGDLQKGPDAFAEEGRWVPVYVPALWETQGFRNYDGFAWYKTEFTLPSQLSGRSLVLLLGRIDDLDEAFLNGERVGRTGRIYDDPGRNNLSNEYSVLRAYTVPADRFRPNARNILLVRVFDGMFHGGIYDGPVGLITRERYLSWRKKQSQENQDKDLWDFLRRILPR